MACNTYIICITYCMSKLIRCQETAKCNNQFIECIKWNWNHGNYFPDRLTIFLYLFLSKSSVETITWKSSADLVTIFPSINTSSLQYVVYCIISRNCLRARYIWILVWTRRRSDRNLSMHIFRWSTCQYFRKTCITENRTQWLSS